MSSIQLDNQEVKPSAPSFGKYKIYIKNGVPKYLDSQDVEHDYKGEKGDQGIPGNDGSDGPIGPEGPVGPVGPAGSMSLIHKDKFSGVITLPNSTSKTFVWRTSFNAPVGSNGYLIATIGFRGHSTGNDCEFDWELNGSILDGDLVEEMKDTSSLAKNLRTFQIDLNTLNNGAYNLDLYFSKEATGGTAQIKYIQLIVMGV